MGTVSENKKQAVEQTMMDFQQFFSLNGGRVLEIASEGNAAAERLLQLGADNIICSNILEDAQVIESERIRFKQVDATDTGFDAESFDVVFGRAALEHIGSMSRLRNEIVRILKPGGVFYLDGAFMWYSPGGHHLWVTAPSGRLYTFGDADCPIGNWEHLLLSEKELLNELLKRHVDKKDAPVIAHYVYHAEGQNRLQTGTICKAFQEDRVLDVAIIRHEVNMIPPPDLISKYDLQDLVTWRLVIAGRKKYSETEPDILSPMTKSLIEREDRASEELQRLHDSLSWRVTTPLRLVGRIMSRLKLI